MTLNKSQITTWSPRSSGILRSTFQTVDVRIDVISCEAVAVDDASIRLTNIIQHTFSIIHGINFNNGDSASVVKELGHFEVRKSSSQVTRMHFFLKKS